MSYYGQKNYSQTLGNGTYTIAEAGCFLTAFCNLLSQFDINIDPPTLNSWFIEHGIYLKDADGAFEDLAWSSVTSYDDETKVSDTGLTDLPPSSPAIVKFHYDSVETGRPIDHFCAVDRIENGQVIIIDSFDGLIKAPSQYQATYGKPIAWATYVEDIPAPTAPAKTATVPSAPLTAPSGQNYQVVTPIPGYINASSAANRTGSNSQVPAGTYEIYNQVAGMINVTLKPGYPGWWINPGDNVAPRSNTETPTTELNYTLTRSVPGFMTSNEAANHIDSTVTLAAGTYFIYNEDNGMFNLTNNQGKPGAWINPADNNPPAPKPAVSTVAPTVNPLTSPPLAGAPDFRTTYKALVNAPVKYLALSNAVIHDYATKRPDLNLAKYDVVPVAGTFLYNGVLYARTPNSIKNGYWYGLPMDILELDSDVFATKTDTVTRKAVGSMNLRDHLVTLIASIKSIFTKKK